MVVMVVVEETSIRRERALYVDGQNYQPPKAHNFCECHVPRMVLHTSTLIVRTARVEDRSRRCTCQPGRRTASKYLADVRALPSEEDLDPAARSSNGGRSTEDDKASESRKKRRREIEGGGRGGEVEEEEEEEEEEQGWVERTSRRRCDERRRRKYGDVSKRASGNGAWNGGVPSYVAGDNIARRHFKSSIIGATPASYEIPNQTSLKLPNRRFNRITCVFLKNDYHNLNPKKFPRFNSIPLKLPAPQGEMLATSHRFEKPSQRRKRYVVPLSPSIN
uniref:Uncharacterized protein n=1 Tax=Vespula pensylvanica TaxID=30213 RepID=A0A834UA70_VESPE|nr:hypothetical protein H0235_007819 [Vespula pensylvanica]